MRTTLTSTIAILLLSTAAPAMADESMPLLVVDVEQRDVVVPASANPTPHADAGVSTDDEFTVASILGNEVKAPLPQQTGQPSAGVEPGVQSRSQSVLVPVVLVYVPAGLSLTHTQGGFEVALAVDRDVDGFEGSESRTLVSGSSDGDDREVRLNGCSCSIILPGLMQTPAGTAYDNLVARAPDTTLGGQLSLLP